MVDYSKTYFESGCGGNDHDRESWMNFFRRIATNIISSLNPHTVLDIGCAFGYLVEALREQGVEAWGIDRSNDAIEQSAERLRPYLFAQSAGEPLPSTFPQKFDLIVSIEVLEHLHEEEMVRVLDRMASYSDQLLISASFSDFREPTHFNVQPPAYWVRKFAELGYFEHATYDGSFLTPQTILMIHQPDMTLGQLAFDYKQALWQMQTKLQPVKDEMGCETYSATICFDTGAGFTEEQKDVVTFTAQNNHVSWSNLLPDGCRMVRFAPVKDFACSVAGFRAEYNGEKIEPQYQSEIQAEGLIYLSAANSQILLLIPSFQDTACLSIMADITPLSKSGLSELFGQINELQELTAQAKQSLARERQQNNQAQLSRETYRKMYEEISNSSFWRITKPMRAVSDKCKQIMRVVPGIRLVYKSLSIIRHNGWRALPRKIISMLTQHKRKNGTNVTSNSVLDQQRNMRFSQDITVSILTPLYNTPKSFLLDMIRSVQAQTYGKWELCLADGSDAQYDYVQKICEAIALKDNRIKYEKLSKNLGISENTNACMKMSTGEYCALLDHDDMLHPSALYEVMRAVCQQEADFIYSDENTFSNKPADAYCPNFKPDFSPDTLRSLNYICHLSAFSRTLFDQVGGFRSRFDGSQDYDLILRLTEAAHKIVHIPKVLYFWRASANSVASDVGAKPYAIAAAKAALEEHLQRVGLEASVMDARIPSTYSIQYKITDNPLVSIIIPSSDHASCLKVCLQSILNNTTYRNYEIIILENGSTEKETFDYYQTIESMGNVHVIKWGGVFNYSAINNFGVRHANGKYIVLLNDDTEIITHDWIEQMLMFAQREDVGAVGAMLYYPNDTIQHAGVILGIGGVAGHSHKYMERGCAGFMSRVAIAQNLSAVTGACMMIRRTVFEEVGGLDESYAVAFNDIDLCMRIRKKEYLIVFTPFAELYHYESKSRGAENTPEKKKRFRQETARFQTRWGKSLAAGDPYYNPNLSLTIEDFSLR